MSTKTKILVSVSVVCLIISVALVAVVAVYAATQQTVTNSVSISYSVTDVIGTCQASYKVKNSSSFTSIGTVNFQAADAENKSQTISNKDISLTAANDYVEFRYTFTNGSSSSDGLDYTVALTYSDDTVDDKNVSIEYSFGATSSTTASYSTTKTPVVADWSNHTIGTTGTVKKGATYYVFIRVSITNTNTSAAFSGSFKWTVSAVKAA